MGRGVKVVVALVCAVLLSGCGSGGDPSAGHSRGSLADGSQADAAGGVDPQVLQDAIEYAFPVPGHRILRNMRVDTFTTGWVIEQCGGTAGPVDSTADRLEQDTYPDLDLIHKKGLREPDTQTWKGARPGCDAASKGNLDDRLPADRELGKVKSRWEDDVILSTLQDAGLVALKKPFAECLRKDSYVRQLGIKVSDDAPQTSFLLNMNEAELRAHVKEVDPHNRLGRLYADCGKDYFGELTKLLLAQRPAQVERNRELLEKFARQLSGLGYVP